MNDPDPDEIRSGIVITIRRDPDDEMYVATVRELPGCVSQGRTVPEAARNIAEAIDLHCTARGREPLEKLS